MAVFVSIVAASPLTLCIAFLCMWFEHHTEEFPTLSYWDTYSLGKSKWPILLQKKTITCGVVVTVVTDARTCIYTHVYTYIYIYIYINFCRGQRLSKTINFNRTFTDTGPGVEENHNPIKTVTTIKAKGTPKFIISFLKTTLKVEKRVEARSKNYNNNQKMKRNSRVDLFILNYLLFSHWNNNNKKKENLYRHIQIKQRIP